MNQILVTKKLYITPELKRKKKIYKFDFFLSVFLVCILISFYIYAEYARNRDEQVSQEILANMNITEDTTVADSNVLIAVLDDEEQTEELNSEVKQQVENASKTVQTTDSGFRYATIATINIPKINVEYPILDGETDSVEETEALLKISPTKFWGPEPNEVGNFCIAGHNYDEENMFNHLIDLQIGDTLYLTDEEHGKCKYKIYDIYRVKPQNTKPLLQDTEKVELTLITCVNYSRNRLIVKAVQTNEI